MISNLYITSIEPNSGKSLILLGIMELLSKRIRRLGFFRPIIQAGTQPDNDIELIRRRYHLDFPYQDYYGVTYEETRDLIAEGEFEEILQRIIEKYKALEEKCDFIVCEGTDFTDIISAFEFNFNAEIANQLDAPILLVANGQEKSQEEVISSVKSERKAFIEKDLHLVATMVNRISLEQFQSISEQLEQIWSYDDPVFVLPEIEALAKPTVGEIVAALEGEFLHGDPEQLKQEVLSFKVAAMQVTNFLYHIREGCLIVTPGDRADIILACLASAFSETYPNIAGIILTGGLELPPSLQTLIQGFKKWTVPVFTVETDTYNTATIINHIRSKITPDNERKIASALGLFENHIDTSKIEKRISLSHSSRITPMMFEYELVARAKKQRQHIVLPEGTEERILKASEILLRRGVVDITLLGNPHEIREKATVLGLKLEGVNIINPMISSWHEDYAQTYYQLRKHKGITEDYARDVMHDLSYFGTMMVHKGMADGMVSGAVHTTGHTIRPALEFIKTQPGCSIVSSVFFMCLEDQVLVYGDCAVNPNPNPQQLADIAISSALTAKQFGVEPLVAMLSYSTGESGQGKDVDKVREATLIARQLRPDLKIEGPIQYDAAVDEDVAKTKLPGSEVAGHATVFIFPDLNTGNNTYKAVQRSASAVAIGPVLQGLNKPVNDLSRGCTITDIVNTVAITAIQAQGIN
ncbi:MAG TPA: phosphate acetyltransferase [Planktothrix sp. UBA8407]|jgi:phosphate acetyltransferase|nr:phosphate acetyltransferase [Planktothrix sp. UBA8402]HAO11598.1 phosphate acetyltransferase [Planktothrix sp. UBA8407]HBK22053.1 phosphate acetyltransferase [Planktothrix sp. UBA10369]